MRPLLRFRSLGFRGRRVAGQARRPAGRADARATFRRPPDLRRRSVGGPETAPLQSSSPPLGLPVSRPEPTSLRSVAPSADSGPPAGPAASGAPDLPTRSVAPTPCRTGLPSELSPHADRAPLSRPLAPLQSSTPSSCTDRDDLRTAQRTARSVGGASRLRLAPAPLHSTSYPCRSLTASPASKRSSPRESVPPPRQAGLSAAALLVLCPFSDSPSALDPPPSPTVTGRLAPRTAGSRFAAAAHRGGLRRRPLTRRPGSRRSGRALTARRGHRRRTNAPVAPSSARRSPKEPTRAASRQRSFSHDLGPRATEVTPCPGLRSLPNTECGTPPEGGAPATHEVLRLVADLASTVRRRPERVGAPASLPPVSRFPTRLEVDCVPAGAWRRRRFGCLA